MRETSQASLTPRSLGSDIASRMLHKSTLRAVKEVHELDNLTKGVKETLTALSHDEDKTILQTTLSNCSRSLNAIAEDLRRIKRPEVSEWAKRAKDSLEEVQTLLDTWKVRHPDTSSPIRINNGESHHYIFLVMIGLTECDRT